MSYKYNNMILLLAVVTKITINYAILTRNSIKKSDGA